MAAILSGVVVVMVGMAYAAVPLYQIFCQVTGYGGTPKIATGTVSPVAGAGTGQMTVRFNADVSRQLPWRFNPTVTAMTIGLGEPSLAVFVATNLSDRPVTGTATFNVTPLKAAQYVTKVECFCFTRQSLAPGERAQMPVSFYVDPAIAQDPTTHEINTITLSYTFFQSKETGG